MSETFEMEIYRTFTKKRKPQEDSEKEEKGIEIKLITVTIMTA